LGCGGGGLGHPERGLDNACFSGWGSVGHWDMLPIPYNQVRGFHTETFRSSPILPQLGTLPETMSVYLCSCVTEDGLFSLSCCLESRQTASVCAQACACGLVVFLDRGACSSALENSFLKSPFLASLSCWLSEPTLSFDPSYRSTWGCVWVPSPGRQLLRSVPTEVNILNTCL